MTKQIGDRKICQVCQREGITIEIHVRKVSDKFGERLRWSNPDGSSHFAVEEMPDGQEQFVHVPTKGTEESIILDEIRERLARVERAVGIVMEE